ncbi:MAG TPA: HlyD family secretion protein [Xanthobacteraceae bacterium]|jgi:multidrug resistance efflux pump|nr:HlyD family secretion protein [Xanthobacteraceae bacterium]
MADVESKAPDTEVESRAKDAAPVRSADDDLPPPLTVRGRSKSRARIVPVLITLGTVLVAGMFGWAMWNTYMGTPWTRDGTVRVYVTTIAPEVAGRIVEIPVVDNQFVHKGDVLLRIDPTNYQIAVTLADAEVQRTKAAADNAEREAKRREELTSIAVTEEERQTFESNAVVARAQYQQAQANLRQAQVNLDRTQIHSPVNGWVTNLLAEVGDYATIGQNRISVIDADSFWVDAYFEETHLQAIREGDPANVKLMGYPQIVTGHVASIAHGITTPNAKPDETGLASVNPIFTWVRLAQRVPVRIRIDHVPDGLHLAAGMTATVEVGPKSAGQQIDAGNSANQTSPNPAAH